MNSHNPDNLTPEQVGVSEGWRLLDEDEMNPTAAISLKAIECWSGAIPRRWHAGYYGHCDSSTYRAKLTRADLRKARGLEPEHCNNCDPSFTCWAGSQCRKQPTPSAVSAEAREAAEWYFADTTKSPPPIELVCQRAIESARAKDRATIERLTAENAMYSLDVKKCRAASMYFTEDPSEIVCDLIQRKETAEKERDQLREELRTARVDQYELVASREAKEAIRYNRTMAGNYGKLLQETTEKLAAVTKELSTAYYQLRAIAAIVADCVDASNPHGVLYAVEQYAAETLRTEQQLATATARAERLAKAVKAAGEKFREYEVLHAAKLTGEGITKSAASAKMAAMREAALAEEKA